MATDHHLDLRPVLGVRPGDAVDVTRLDTDASPGFAGDKAAGEAALAALGPEISGLQERLWARSRSADTSGEARSVLLVLQGLDTAGKGGILRHVVGMVDPQGVAVRGFKAPTPEEREHDFLWRIRKALPGAGLLGVFDRSHYEDVLVARVAGLVPRAEWEGRYALINDFEAEVVAGGTAVVKVMLHVSYAEQGRRLAERLDRPDKYWKYNPGDIDTRQRWDDYQAAYSDALTRCSTTTAPWHVVPADRKWYARLAVASLLRSTLAELDTGWPPATFDIEVEKERLAATG